MLKYSVKGYSLSVNCYPLSVIRLTLNDPLTINN